MNDTTRKDVQTQIENIFTDNGFSGIADEVRQLADDEREKIGNIPDGTITSVQLEALEEAADTLDEAADKLEEAAWAADEAADLLSTITGA